MSSPRPEDFTLAMIPMLFVHPTDDGHGVVFTDGDRCATGDLYPEREADILKYAMDNFRSGLTHALRNEDRKEA